MPCIACYCRGVFVMSYNIPTLYVISVMLPFHLIFTREHPLKLHVILP